LREGENLVVRLAVLDIGKTLIYKTLVVEMALQSLTTQEIARRIYHTPAV